LTEYTINEQLPSLNDYIQKCRYNRFAAAKFKEETDNLCGMYALKARIALKEVFKEPAILFTTYCEKHKKRDLDNIYSADKYILDSLQQIGVLENDNPAHIKGIYHGLLYGKEAYVRVRVYSLSERDRFWTDFLNQEEARLTQEYERSIK
jgi:Holliday junction resolvase RusA-like endonuclease